MELRLRNEFVNKYGDNISHRIIKAINSIVKIHMNSLIDDLEKNQIDYKFINNIISSVQFIEYLKKDESNYKKIVNISYSKPVYINNFIQNPKGKNSKMYDLISISLNYKGYNDFVKSFHKEKGSNKKKQNKLIFNSNSSPINHPALKTFFKLPCYIYAYDEDLTEENKKTDINHFHYPNIDALVLSYKNDFFSIENVERVNSKVRKLSHYKGKVKWCTENKKSRNDLNAFDIDFEDSPTKLKLRIHFPYEHYNNGQKYANGKNFNILLGVFMNIKIQGGVSIGTIVIEKNTNKSKSLTPYKYKYKKGESPKPHLAIQNYLYDRYKNWIKVKTNILNIESLEEWVKLKNKKNYTNHEIKMFDFLISYPHSSLVSEKDEINIGKTLHSIFSNPKLILKDSNLINNVDLERISNYLSRKWKNDRIRIYPPPKSIREELTDINMHFFRELKHTVNAVFIIPKLDYKRISSSYTVIGYCIALKKRTFVFFHKDIRIEERPNILSRSEKDVNLFVMPYEKIIDIPAILINGVFKEDWEEGFKDNLI